MRLLEFRTATGLSFDVAVDRAFDVGRCEFRGRSLTWLSSTGTVGPWYAEPMGLGWFRSWGGGMLVTCGLDHTLLGGFDSAEQFHQDVQTEVEYGLHGRIGMLPAQLVGYGERWDGDECTLWAEGLVRQAAVFGEAMEIRRRIEVSLSGTAMRISDEVSNVGYDPVTHMLLYHVNVGYPVLDEGSRLLIPAPPGTPTGDDYPPGDYRVMSAPRRGCKEECYEHAVRQEPDGTAPVALVNDAIELGVYQLYDARTMPFHTLWRMLGEGTYGVALEPTTNRDAGRFDAEERGELQWLQPGESRRYRLEIGVLDGSAEIARFEERVSALVP
ncbi:MAG: hypothetical protein JWM85_3094 [Acidimicrobiaceae bacterium]|nr:hypothetical protein [Acidimicrobiaceae bacterium]